MFGPTQPATIHKEAARIAKATYRRNSCLSEYNLQRELDLPLRPGVGLIGRLRDCAIRTARHGGGRQEKIRAVHNVEDFGAELDRKSLCHPELSRDASVEIQKTGTREDVSPGI